MKYFLIMLCLFGSLGLQAQYSIQSKIVSKTTGEALEFVAVRLLKTDSTLVAGQTTDSLGTFILKDIKPGKYILKATSVGYLELKQNLQVVNQNVNLENLQMTDDSKVLKDLNVTGTQIQVVTKGDTIEYNAAAFKTSQNAVLEDALKKMPGVEVGTDGKITVNGQEVTKILVEGKKFFGDDTQMATKNIPANMIDKVQVVDQKSDMAQLTGFDDGDTERVINLRLRSDKRQGIFGNVQLGVGTDINPEFRYDSNGFLNIMDGDSRSTITAGANNTNTSRSRRGRGGFGGQTSGITETQNLGYNLNKPLSEKLTIGGDVTFNHSDNLQTSESHRENYLEAGTYTTNSNNTSKRNNYESNLRLEAEWKPDTMNTVVFQPTMGFSRSFSNSNSDYLYLMEKDSTSWGKTNNTGNGFDLNAGLNVIYSHKFAKRGRTLTTNINTRISQSDDGGFNNSQKYTVDSVMLVDQRSATKSNQYNLGARLSYVEPLWNNRHFLETALSFNSVLTNSSRDLFNKDANGNYNVFNADYSNDFKNIFLREALELNYRYIEQNYNLTLGVKAEPSQTSSTIIYGDGTGRPITNNVVNFAPSARFQYNFAKRKFARLDYDGRTQQPSINQMQPVKNNTDLMNETVGNPDLNPAFQHNLRLMFSNYNTENLSSLNMGIRGSLTKDALASNSIYDQTGKRFIQTVNSKELPYNLNIFTMYSIPFLKKFNFGNQAFFGIQQQYGYTSKNVNSTIIDVSNLPLGDLSSTRGYNASENMSLSYTQDVVDVSLRGGLRYSNSQNNFNKNVAQTYDWSGTLNVGLRPTKSLTFTTDLSYTKQNGYSTFNPSQWLWNAGVDMTAFKGKGVFSFKAFDILRQRQNVNQTVGDNYIQYSKTNALPSYFLVSFTYKINKFNGGSDQDRQDLENMNHRGPGMGRGMRMGPDGPGRGSVIAPMPFM